MTSSPPAGGRVDDRAADTARRASRVTSRWGEPCSSNLQHRVTFPRLSRTESTISQASPVPGNFEGNSRDIRTSREAWNNGVT